MHAAIERAIDEALEEAGVTVDDDDDDDDEEE